MTPPKPIPEMTPQDWIDYNQRRDRYEQKMLGWIIAGPIIGMALILIIERI